MVMGVDLYAWVLDTASLFASAVPEGTFLLIMTTFTLKGGIIL